MRSIVAFGIRKAIGILSVLLALAMTAAAGGPAPIPEVDPGGLGAALALFAVGYLVVASRLKRR